MFEWACREEFEHKLRGRMFAPASHRKSKTPPVAGRQMGHPQNLLPGQGPANGKCAATRLVYADGDRIYVIGQPEELERRFSPQTGEE